MTAARSAGRPYAGGLVKVLKEVRDERRRQDEKWGPVQTMPDGTYWSGIRQGLLNAARRRNDEGQATFASVLTEEVYEALLEADPVLLRAELVQVAAVAVKWIEHLDRERSV